VSTELFTRSGRGHEEKAAPWVIAHEGVLEVAKERAKLEQREGGILLTWPVTRRLISARVGPSPNSARSAPRTGGTIPRAH
jgi:hypothetical protein